MKIVVFNNHNLTCLVLLLAVTVIRTTKHRIEVEVHARLTRTEQIAYLYLICMNSSSIPMTYHMTGLQTMGSLDLHS